MEEHYATEQLALTKEAESCWTKLAAGVSWGEKPPEIISNMALKRGFQAYKNNPNAVNVPRVIKGKA